MSGREKRVVPVSGEPLALPRLTELEWAKRRGSDRVQNGELQAHTDTDYLIFICPKCRAELMGGTGIDLIGYVQARLHKVLLFQIACECGLRDHFKLPFGSER